MVPDHAAAPNNDAVWRAERGPGPSEGLTLRTTGDPSLVSVSSPRCSTSSPRSRAFRAREGSASRAAEGGRASRRRPRTTAGPGGGTPWRSDGSPRSCRKCWRAGRPVKATNGQPAGASHDSQRRSITRRCTRRGPGRWPGEPYRAGSAWWLWCRKVVPTSVTG